LPSDEGNEKPQLLEQQAVVVASTTQNIMQRIAKHTFQRIAPDSPLSLNICK
jgi:hypothetical protein